MESLDYKKRKYLSAIESAKYLNISVRLLHDFVKMQTIMKINAPKVRIYNQIQMYKRNWFVYINVRRNEIESWILKI